GQQNMRNCLIVVLLAFSLLIGVAVTGTVQASSKAKSTSKRASVNKRSNRNLKAGVRRHSTYNKFAARREMARRRAAAYRRAAIARARAVDNHLLRVAEEQITDDDPTGEDPEMRRVAVNALGDHPGTVVLMDPNTGRIYSIVNQHWALGKPFKPCSTIKLIT